MNKNDFNFPSAIITYVESMIIQYMTRPIVMSIGGSDPSGGAGIQADIKAFSLLGVHGTTALTTLTIQNTQQVVTTIPLTEKDVERQIDILMDDFPIKYVKTGLLHNKSIIDLVSQKCNNYQWDLIVDPVLVSTTGDVLANSDIIKTYQSTLLPEALMVTPNIIEAETKMLASEINRNEGPLFGDEKLEVEETIVDEKFCRGCGIRLRF